MTMKKLSKPKNLPKNAEMVALVTRLPGLPFVPLVPFEPADGGRDASGASSTLPQFS